MKPYFQDESVTIYNCDARELLHVRADLLMTDPPYGIREARKGNASRSVLAVSRDYGDADWDDKPIPRDVIDGLIRTAKWAALWGGNYYALPPSPSWLVWDKDNGANDFADCELAWTNWPTAVRRIRYRWHGMLQENMARKEVRTHPNQKPLAVIKWAISLAPQVPLTVFDPFMGSGTTLRAAKDLGMRAIGCDLSERYCEDAANRMAQGVLAYA